MDRIALFCISFQIYNGETGLCYKWVGISATGRSYRHNSESVDPQKELGKEVFIRCHTEEFNKNKKMMMIDAMKAMIDQNGRPT